jgi:hypothetical protein
MVEQFEKLEQGDIDRTLAGLTANAPAVKQAQAKLDAANRVLDSGRDSSSWTSCRASSTTRL